MKKKLFLSIILISLISSSLIIIIFSDFSENSSIFNENIYFIIENYMNKDFSDVELGNEFHTKKLKALNGVIWHFYQSNNTNIQIAEFNNKVVAIFIKSNKLNELEISKRLRIYKNTVKINYANFEETLYLDDNSKTVNSSLRISDNLKSKYDILFSDERIYNEQILFLINHERTIRKIKELEKNKKLYLVSKKYSCNMLRNNFFSHIDDQGKSPMERLEEKGYKFELVGENLVKGEMMTSFHAHNKLMNSYGHKKNILNNDYTHNNVGSTLIDGKIFVCEIFVKIDY
ncbi:MAG: hypothetical protein SCJ93_04365 [Bacillota bacterium]|nr:hypothetical protein [Bacillota bacterium]